MRFSPSDKEKDSINYSGFEFEMKPFEIVQVSKVNMSQVPNFKLLCVVSSNISSVRSSLQLYQHLRDNMFKLITTMLSSHLNESVLSNDSQLIVSEGMIIEM